MNENEMLDSLQSVWENMTMDKDRTAYAKMLVLLDDMYNFLHYDLQIKVPVIPLEIKAEEFTF